MEPRLVVLASGGGSNLQAILDAIGAGTLDAEVALVVANRRAAFALERARRASIPALYFPLAPYQAAGRAAYDAALAGHVAAARPDLIVLAGWMHIFSPAFLDRFPGRVLNLHPALPGVFPGTQAIARAYAAYRRGEIGGGGCMVHYVVHEVDAGPVLMQASVPIHPDDTLAAFEARLHAAEHAMLVAAIAAHFADAGVSR